VLFNFQLKALIPQSNVNYKRLQINVTEDASIRTAQREVH
jgi:hypothetical protein